MQAIVNILRALALLFALLLTGHAPAMAQAEQPASQEQKIDASKLLVPRKNADGSRDTASFWQSPGRWVIGKQQQFYGAMSQALRRIKSEGIAAAASTLLLLSFAYGVFHAAGPGHGKTVVSAWLLATENDLKRGIFISFLSSIIQALSAIVLVGSLLLLVSGAAGAARNIAGLMESASYAMIGMMGVYLVWTAFRMLLNRPPRLAAAEGPDFSGFQPLAHSHAHLASGEICSDCGHAHAPNPADIRGDWSLAKAFSMAFAVGIRPCTGAILVLILSNVLGLFWIGVLATLAMAFGTFLTVSAIAILSVYARKFAIRFASGNDRWLAITGLTLRFGGGLLIAFLGLSLFIGSLTRTGGMI